MDSAYYAELYRRASLNEQDTEDESQEAIHNAIKTSAGKVALHGYRITRLPDLSRLSRLSELDISFTLVDDLTPLAGALRLKRLSCNDAPISRIDALAGLVHLTDLDLTATRVVDVAPITGLKQLRTLKCGSTGVEDLEPLAGLTSLRLVELYNTRIGSISHLAGLLSLEVLLLSQTGVEDISCIALLTKLKRLQLSYTRVTDLTPVFRLTAIRDIQAMGIDITSVSGIESLRSLDSLTISGSGVADLSPLSRSKTLRALTASETPISDITPLSSVTTLTTLNLSESRVVDLTPLRQLTYLEELHLDGTDVVDITPLAGLSRLTSLSLARTAVSDLSPLRRLKGLLSLSISSTQIADLSPVGALSSLKSLRMMHSPVTDLSTLRELSNLQTLDFDGSCVKTLEGIECMTALERFDCSNTRVVEWPRQLFQMPNLISVIASKSRIGSVPAEELSAHYGDNCLGRLRSYFEDLDAGAAPLDRIKLIVLGNGRVGKTQMRRWLLHSSDNPSPFDPSVPTTHGIDVLRGAISVPQGDLDGASGQYIDASLWDFGGQDIYHGTHSLFMKTRAIFVLCWCPEEEGRHEQTWAGISYENQPMGYWLDFVRQLAGTGNPVLIVQTQCDSASVEEPMRHSSLDVSGFEMVKFLQFSAKTGRGGAALREAIGDAAAWLRETHGVPLIGQGRLSVLNQLDDWRSEGAEDQAGLRQHKMLTQEKFGEICDASGGIAKPAHFLNFLHQSGVVFYRPGLFGDRIVLDQNWALEAIYTAFDRTRCLPVLLANRGRFTAELIGRLAWQDYSQDEQSLFLTMMQSCDIAFVHDVHRYDPRLTEYIAPDLLPPRDMIASAIESRWRGGDSPCVQTLRFSLLHKGLMRNILSHVGRGARLNAEYWRDGVLFYERNRQSDAIIEAMYDSNGWGGEVLISCRSGRASELLEVLTQEVREIATRIGLRPDEVTTGETEALAEKGDETPLALEFAAPPREGPHWYVSYAWGDDTVEGIERTSKVESLCESASARGVTIIRDKNELRNGDSIRRFMQELSAGDRIIVILSDKYLRSANCMFELYESWIKHKTDAAEFTVAVRAYKMSCAKIGTPLERAKIAAHWARQVEELTPYLHNLGGADLVDLQLARNYANNVGDILYLINDRISPRDWDAFLDWAFEI